MINEPLLPIGLVIGFKWTHWLLHKQSSCYMWGITYSHTLDHDCSHKSWLYICQWAISMNHYSQNLCDIFLFPLEIVTVIITTWYYTFSLGSMIQDIKCQFPCYIKFQHVTSNIRISPSCSNISVLISWINLKDQWTWSGPKMCWLYQCRKI